jgi:SUZ domain
MTPENPDFGGAVAVATSTTMIDASSGPHQTPKTAEHPAGDGQCAEPVTSFKLPQHESEIPSPGTYSTLNPSTDGMPVDSALLSAMRDPRERVGVLKLEQSMVEFMRNTELQSISVGGPYNSVVIGLRPTTQSTPDLINMGRTTSFQRCWLHRLCDRFHISRESLDLDWIALNKTEYSSTPKQLLIHLDPSQYSLEEQMSTLTVTKPGKMKIMKRSGSNSFGSSGSLLEKSERKKSSMTNLTEKEKAYAEARARIFNNGNGAAEYDTATSVPLLTPSQVLLPAQEKLPERPSQQADRFKASSSMGGVSKVTWRNRQQEEADPDFQRQQSVSYYGTGYPYQQQQQQQPPQYYGQYEQQYYVHQQYYQGDGYHGGRTGNGGRGRGRVSNRGGRGRQPSANIMDEFPTL